MHLKSILKIIYQLNYSILKQNFWLKLVVKMLVVVLIWKPQDYYSLSCYIKYELPFVLNKLFFNEFISSYSVIHVTKLSFYKHTLSSITYFLIKK